MKLTRKQRIALEFLAEVGPVAVITTGAYRLVRRLCDVGMVRIEGGQFSSYHITKQGREALKEAQK